MAYADIRDLFVQPDWLAIIPGLHQCWQCRRRSEDPRGQPNQDTRSYFCNRWCRFAYVSALVQRHGVAVCPSCFSATGQPHRPNCLVEICEKTSWRCALCGDPVDPSLREPDPRRPTFDHVRPQAEGGIKTDDNLRLTHFQCNVERRWLSDDDWRQKTGFSPL
jgi:hypothetical protein